MATSKKSWLYAGLVLAAGAVAVRLLNGPRLKRGLRVLLVGDSLAVGMAPHFLALAKEAGIDLRVLAKQGTRIDQWASSAELKQLVDSFKPELVLISLGTNDEYMQGDGVVTKQRAALEQFIARLHWSHSHDYGLGPEHIVWIGPPALPKASNGISAMIQDAGGSVVSPRFHYFHSERLNLPRAPDRIHMSVRGYAGWAGAVWHWLS